VKRLSGAWGERLARRHALWRGATLVEANPRTAGGELDLVLRHWFPGWAPAGWGVWVFAEVKTRREGERLALEAVDARKQARVVRAALAWLQGRGLEPEQLLLRFDVFAVCLDPRGRPRVTWLQGAFEAPDREW
jgi:putative endonuclease